MKVVYDAQSDTLFRVVRVSGEVEIITAAEYDRRQQLKRRPRYILVEKARIHVCSTCGNSGPWTESWSWFGSYADLDDDRPVKKYCSAECQPSDSSQ